MTTYYAGLDLGQAADFTALSIAQKMPPPPDGGRDEYQLFLGHLQRWPLGTSYVKMAEDMAALLSLPPLRGDTTLALDETGVGKGVCDIFDRLGLDILRVTITSGEQRTQERRSYHVPKKDLVGGLLVLLEQRRLHVAQSLPEASSLVNELMNYRQRRSATGYQSFDAREGQHDDLVLAAALSAWAVDSAPALPFGWMRGFGEPSEMVRWPDGEVTRHGR